MQLSRSSVLQQRLIAITTLGNILFKVSCICSTFLYWNIVISITTSNFPGFIQFGLLEINVKVVQNFFFLMLFTFPTLFVVCIMYYFILFSVIAWYSIWKIVQQLHTYILFLVYSYSNIIVICKYIETCYIFEVTMLLEIHISKLFWSAVTKQLDNVTFLVLFLWPVFISEPFMCHFDVNTKPDFVTTNSVYYNFGIWMSLLKYIILMAIIKEKCCLHCKPQWLN